MATSSVIVIEVNGYAFPAKSTASLTLPNVINYLGVKTEINELHPPNAA